MFGFKIILKRLIIWFNYVKMLLRVSFKLKNNLLGQF